MSIKATKILALNEANAAVLVELVTGPNISENLRIQAMERLIGSKEGESFAKTAFEEKLTYGECPHCKHLNHWLVDEESQNQMGWVSDKEDERVPEYTDSENCPEYEQACKKKRINI